MSGRPSTTRHYDLLKVLRKQIIPGKRCPTLTQLEELTGVNKVTINFYLRRLISEGLISREKNSRYISLTGTAEYMPITKLEVRRKKSNAQKQARRTAEKMTPERASECLENAVTLGKERDAGISSSDPFFVNKPLFRNFRMIGSKVG